MATRPINHLRNRRRRGSYFLEFSLTFWPLFVVMLAVVDYSMPIFLRSAFTNAVREGVRYGTTYRTFGSYNHTDSIKQIVIQNSTGFLSASDLTKVEVKFYSPTTYQEVTSGIKNADGNIIEVGIANYNWAWIVPLWRDSNPLTYNIKSADRLETLPRGVARPAAP